MRDRRWTRRDRESMKREYMLDMITVHREGGPTLPPECLIIKNK